MSFLGLLKLTTLSREWWDLKKCRTPERRGSHSSFYFSSPLSSPCVSWFWAATAPLCLNLATSNPGCSATGLEGQIPTYLFPGDTPPFAFCKGSSGTLQNDCFETIPMAMHRLLCFLSFWTPLIYPFHHSWIHFYQDISLFNSLFWVQPPSSHRFPAHLQDGLLVFARTFGFRHSHTHSCLFLSFFPDFSPSPSINAFNRFFKKPGPLDNPLTFVHSCHASCHLKAHSLPPLPVAALSPLGHEFSLFTETMFLSSPKLTPPPQSLFFPVSGFAA